MLERQVTREATTTQQILRVFLWTFLPSCLATWADCPCRSLLLLGLPGPLFSLRILGMTTLLPFVLQIRGGGGGQALFKKQKQKNPIDLRQFLLLPRFAQVVEAAFVLFPPLFSLLLHFCSVLLRIAVQRFLGIHKHKDEKEKRMGDRICQWKEVKGGCGDLQFLVLEEQQRRRTAKWKEEATKGKEDKRYTLTIKASKARSSRRYRRDGRCTLHRGQYLLWRRDPYNKK